MAEAAGDGAPFWDGKVNRTPPPEKGSTLDYLPPLGAPFLHCKTGKDRISDNEPWDLWLIALKTALKSRIRPGNYLLPGQAKRKNPAQFGRGRQFHYDGGQQPVPSQALPEALTMGIEWFYQVAGESRGPVSAQELRALAEAGTITPDTRVKRGSDRKWVSARRVDGLFDPGRVTSVEPLPAPAKGPPPLPPPVCASGKPLPDAVADGSKAGRLRGMRPRHWVLVAGGTAALLVLVGSLSFFGRGDSGGGGSEEQLAEQPAPLSPADVNARAAPGVVIIRSFRVQDSESSGLGSGFVVEPGDVIVTNEHVIRGASHLEVKTHEGKTAHVTGVLAVDEKTDVALLPVPDSLKGTPGLKLATSAPRVGDPVYAIGAPQGLEFTFTEGVVSQIREAFLEYGPVIQHDVSISAGSSGGPLLNGRAEVVGVNTLASSAKQ